MDTFYPKNKEEWRSWLEQNHETYDSIWLIIYKTKSPTPNLSWSEAVDEALCFGWIDSTKKSIDKDSYKQYYSKRKPKSTWSKINKDKVVVLTQKGLMATAGLRCIEIAKSNGCWTLLDDIEDLIIPKDLKAALIKSSKAFDFYKGLSKSSKKHILYWVAVAKRQETRQKRIIDVVESAKENRKPKALN